MFSILVLREIINYREKRDLMNRLMSRSFTEYVQLTSPDEENEVEAAPSGLIDLETAKEELIDA